MLQSISRPDFLGLVGVKSSTLDQRVLTGEAAFALGCKKPAHTGEYLVLDAVAMLLSSMLNRFAGLGLKAAAETVQKHWEGWLTLVTKAERFPTPDDPLLFFAVVWLSLESGLTPRVVMGRTDEIAAALAGQPVYTVNSISMGRVLHQLRTNAKFANVALPERFTIAPNEPGFENWWAEIRTYQDRAKARTRAKAKAKAKGRRPARAPIGKRSLLKVS